MIPLASLKMAAPAFGAGVELYDEIQKMKRRRPENQTDRGTVETMDAIAKTHLRTLCLYRPVRPEEKTP